MNRKIIILFCSKGRHITSKYHETDKNELPDHLWHSARSELAIARFVEPFSPIRLSMVGLT